MIRSLECLLALSLLACLACSNLSAKSPEVRDPAVAQADPDFAVQGEYVGEGTRPDGSNGKLGAQIIARGKGTFAGRLLLGGLPGDGFDRGQTEWPLSATTTDQATTLAGEGLGGTITDGKLLLTDADGKKLAELTRTDRTSPTLCKKAPEGAIVLFDAKTNDFGDSHRTEAGDLLSGVTSTAAFDGQYRIHLEFRLTWMPEAQGQGRSNSGVYVHDCYEIQVLDSFGLDGKDNECGGLYKVGPPKSNLCFTPMRWQTYDIDFTAPKYTDGKKTINARITVRHNNVIVHDNVELPNGTPGRQGEGPGPRPLHLQGHGNHVEYRNVWISTESP